MLGSGSAGNATVIEAHGTRLLVDAGLSARQLTQRLAALGVDPDDLDGILLSHEHSDHTRGLEVFLRKREVPVYATALTREVLDERCPGVAWRVFQRGQAFAVGGVEVTAFAVPHDAVDPVGFVCGGAEARIGVATDLGHVTALVRETLRGVRALFVESNYDQELLEADTKRPWSIKQRITSRHGHLSNHQTVEWVGELVPHGLETVVLGHLSRDCNGPRVAARTLEEAVPGIGGLHVASQQESTGWIEVMEPEPQVVAADPYEQGVLF